MLNSPPFRKPLDGRTLFPFGRKVLASLLSSFYALYKKLRMGLLSVFLK
jgi:hypothetical protein